MPAAASCYEQNNCNFTDCVESGSDPSNFSDFIQTCCPNCVDSINSTATCFSSCLPPCVDSTTASFGSCASSSSSCGETCQTSSGGIPTIPVAALNGSQAQSGSSNGSLFGDSICSHVESVYQDDICSAADCCMDCMNEYIALQECVLNDVLLGGFLQLNENCTIDCGTSTKTPLNGATSTPGTMHPTTGTMMPGNGTMSTPIGTVPPGTGTMMPGNGTTTGTMSPSSETMMPGNGSTSTPIGTVSPGAGTMMPGNGTATGTMMPGNGTTTGTMSPTAGTMMPGNGMTSMPAGTLHPVTQAGFSQARIESCQQLMSAYRAVGKEDAAYGSYVSCIHSSLAAKGAGANNGTYPGNSGNHFNKTPEGSGPGNFNMTASAWSITEGGSASTIVYGMLVSLVVHFVFS